MGVHKGNKENVEGVEGEGVVGEYGMLEEIQPSFMELDLRSMVMGIEDDDLNFNRVDMDMYILQMTSRFYERLTEKYTLEELSEIPEVEILEGYIWERLGVSSVELESTRERLPELLEAHERELMQKELRVQRNRSLLLDNVYDVRYDFNGERNEELFDYVVGYAGVDREEVKELVYIILEVSFYLRSRESELVGAEFRERVLAMTVEGLWNSRSSLAYMALNTEYQPLLTLLVELTVSQIEYKN
jgi:hypothetical protein